jgi:hypothetical protein
MITVEIEQYYTGSVWECEIWYHHARDGEYAPHTDSEVVSGQWIDAVIHAHKKYGEEISGLSVSYRREHDGE